MRVVCELVVCELVVCELVVCLTGGVWVWCVRAGVLTPVGHWTKS